LGTGPDAFKAVFGEQNFSFIAGRVKFVCLNTNAMEYDYSNPVPDFTFMKEQWTADSAAFDRTVVCMHARPGTEQFNSNVFDVFQHYVNRNKGLLFCVAGHEHNPDVYDVYGDGVLYYVTASANRRNYYIFTITPEGYTYEQVFY